jgi:hypothetical protein
VYLLPHAYKPNRGDPKPVANISLNGQSIGVAKTLFEFLSIVALCLQDRNRRMNDHIDGENYYWIDALCIYVYRHRKKTLRNLRFGPLFSEGFLFPSRISKPLFIRLCDALPILSLDLYILTVKWTNFNFRRPFSKFEMKLFLNISIPLINLNPY